MSETGTTRAEALERLLRDLMGPDDPEEFIPDRPSDRYVTGILYAAGEVVSPEHDDETNDDGAREFGPVEEVIPLAAASRPSTAGVSFAISTHGVAPSVQARLRCGTYKYSKKRSHGLEMENGDSQSEAEEGASGWRRTQHEIETNVIELSVGATRIDLLPLGLPQVELYFQTSPWNSAWLVTAAVVNKRPMGESRAESEEAALFQTELVLEPAAGTSLVARPSRRSAIDEDDRSAALVYRDALEYAVGHTCSASWELDQQGNPISVRTTWVPTAIVPDTSPEGDPIFEELRSPQEQSPFSAQALCDMRDEELTDALERVVATYEEWILTQAERIATLPPDLARQAQSNLGRCQEAADRMRIGISFMASDALALAAFRLANQAMLRQRWWGVGSNHSDLEWRPFQLGFQLLAFESVANPKSSHRMTMDLLWFPTGGGKTEAYLGLTAFLLFYRRLREGGKEGGDGVSILMRYTLRLLTIQQFQRACRLISACEFFRRGNERASIGGSQLGATPFSIGLWVGSAATPNSVQEALNLPANAETTYRQLIDCPCCGERLNWEEEAHSIQPKCMSDECELALSGRKLPIWTIDELIYREKPSLVIATIDKFAQIARKGETGVLFGVGTHHRSPDLIIQDELHLISGPLGSIAGLYEVAIDELCSINGYPPKVIGSTATIRRAQQQVRALFDRQTFQFPPSAIDAANSCFARQDLESPGRLYAGVTTAGRSAKFLLQAVSASLLQSGSAVAEKSEFADWYWTLVAYFNSLRELGGALVLMQDEVRYLTEQYSNRRNESVRAVEQIAELTSRRKSAEIPAMLDALEKPRGNPDCYDALLASNMISVGVDISRLGLMVVYGQPKTIAEYIQATSRVGRNRPGFVVTIYNSARTRDRSHYETFETWHQALYRDVEATSVTPFASRCVDRALHAVVVALGRQLIPGLREDPRLVESQLGAFDRIVDRISIRALHVDPKEQRAVEQTMERMLDYWVGRRDLEVYWDDSNRKRALLMSAEAYAAAKATGGAMRRALPTPNSMREVEPGTTFLLVNKLQTRTEPSDG